MIYRIKDLIPVLRLNTGMHLPVIGIQNIFNAKFRPDSWLNGIKILLSPFANR